MAGSMWSQAIDFLRWWGDELSGLLPAWLTGRAQPVLPRRILSLETDGVRLIEGRAGSEAAHNAAAGPGAGPVVPLAEMLRRLVRDAGSREAGGSEIGLRVAYPSCFVRRVELPRSAARDAARLLAVDLERVTPFKPKDVLTAYQVDPRQDNPARTAYRQLVIKRATVEGPIEAARAAGLDVVRVDCWSEDGQAALPVDFLEQPDAASSRPGSAWLPAAVLAVVAVALAALAGWLAHERDEAALADIQARAALLKGKVQARRDAESRLLTTMAEAESFRKLRAATGSRLAALEELSRLLPDTAWVTDLRIEGNTIDISGLARQAVQLVPILERSQYFRDATLTAPLTFDSREDKERFSIRVRLRTVQAEQQESGQ